MTDRTTAIEAALVAHAVRENARLLRRQAQVATRNAVLIARAAGWSWRRIGEGLGISKQAAWEIGQQK